MFGTSAEIDARIDERSSEIFRQRKEGLVLVAMQLGLRFERADLQSYEGLARFYCGVAILLAVAMEIPRFQLKKRKWPPGLINGLRQVIDHGKRVLAEDGKMKSDAEILLPWVQRREPELTRAEAKKRARTLANLVAGDRARARRKAEKKIH
jgi:hypothetical protein